MTLQEAYKRVAGCDLIVDTDNHDAVIYMEQWISNPVEPYRGILLIGHVGTGKSTMMRAVSRMYAQRYGLGFGVKTCADLVRSFTEFGYSGEVERWTKAPHICLDDLGHEGQGVHYGTRTDLVGEIIESRYDAALNGERMITHFTTNLSTNQIREKYGERVYSRIVQMCHGLGVGASCQAVDRRREAKALRPIERPEPSNIYATIHPSIMGKLGKLLEPATKRASTKMPEHSRDADLRDFEHGCKHAATESLAAGREKFLLNYPEGAAGRTEALRYVAIIDAELVKRSSTNENTP